jgi:hypothetical protein
MVCANILLTIMAILTIVFAVWPTMIGATNAMYGLVVVAVIVLIVTWTGCKCKYCKK